ncbi:MAG: extracellular solute-binding protein [Hyphomicrobiales bacterium]
MHDEPAEQEGFTHFSYTNPNAPVGGTLRLSAGGTFDSTNPFIVKGIAAQGLRGFTYESLMARSYDEPFSLYGLIAEAVDLPDDRKSIAFRLREEARFSDGTPVTIEDVIFSLETLRDFGRPNYRAYYSKVERIERIDKRTVKFHFAADTDREMPLIVSLMSILPKHVWDGKKFDKTTLEPPIASGPYVVEKIDPGTSITYRRNLDYWGWHLGVNKGRFNFERVRYDYFRDQSSAFEAFKKGIVLFREERNPKMWSNAYDFPAVKKGDVILEKIATGLPAGMAGLVFNTRRWPFKDIRVRQALIYLFDAEWINKSLYSDLYKRTYSIYPRSELAAYPNPASALERELLAPYKASLNQDLIEGKPFLPQSDGSGRDRKSRRMALRLLKEAGYVVRAGKMVEESSSKPLAFEIMVLTRQEERLALAYARALEKSGINVAVRLVDSSQFQARRNDYDFEMIPATWFSSLSPGNEQSFYWSPSVANQPGARNYMGADETGIDAAIIGLIAAKTRSKFVEMARSLDRIIMSQAYFIPLFHADSFWTARWKQLQHPKKTPLYGVRLPTWWMEP